jgi:hypothetical protein
MRGMKARGNTGVAEYILRVSYKDGQATRFLIRDQWVAKAGRWSVAKTHVRLLP